MKKALCLLTAALLLLLPPGCHSAGDGPLPTAPSAGQPTATPEPQPTPEMVRDVPGMADELRRPMMLILSGRKPEGPA